MHCSNGGRWSISGRTSACVWSVNAAEMSNQYSSVGSMPPSMARRMVSRISWVVIGVLWLEVLALAFPAPVQIPLAGWLVEPRLMQFQALVFVGPNPVIQMLALVTVSGLYGHGVL